MGPGDDDEAPEADASNDDDGDDNNDDDGLADDYEDVEGNKDDAASDHPEVDWSPKALRKWRESEVDGGASLFVEWLGKNHVKIRSRPK